MRGAGGVRADDDLIAALEDITYHRALVREEVVDAEGVLGSSVDWVGEATCHRKEERRFFADDSR